MELGQRIRQARLEAGLSQRQLCGDTITRNMLSQIENGSARPSMETLRYLARQLGKPMGYFWEEQAVISPNQEIMEQARQADPEEALAILKGYQAPDPVYDRERYLLEAIACLDLAQEAMEEGRPIFAIALLHQAQAAGAETPYYTQDLERRRLLLCCRAETKPLGELIPALPSLDRELYLRATAALSAGDTLRCIALLEAMEKKTEAYHFLMAEALFCRAEFAAAAEQYLLSEQWDPKAVYPRLEHCYRELEDYKKAYEYACKQR